MRIVVRVLLPLCLCLPIFLTPSRAAVRYVKRDAPGPVHDGASWSTAFQNVQEAVTSTQSGDEVWVAAGTYVGTVSIAERVSISIYGGFNGTETNRAERRLGAESTVLDGGAAGAAVWISSAGATLDGFTIRNGSRGGVRCTADGITIAHNVITGNCNQGYSWSELGVPVTYVYTAAQGAGVFISGNDVRILSNVIAGNSIYIDSGFPQDYDTQQATTCYGGGVYSNGDRTVVRGNVIVNNAVSAIDEQFPSFHPQYASGYGAGGGIAAYGAEAVIADNVIAYNSAGGNRGGGGGAIDATGAVTMTNNTIVRSGEVRATGGGSLANSIVAYGTLTLTGVTTAHNDIFAAAFTPGPTDITVDPLFVDDANADYHLQAGSPCRDAGDDVLVNPGDTDADGNPRIFGQHVDVGGYEQGGTARPLPRFVWHVSPTGSDANSGLSWEQARKSIAGVLSKAEHGEVWVAAGTYSEYIRVPANVGLYGGFSGTETQRSQRDWRRNLTTISNPGEPVSTGSGGIFDGFVIQGASTGVYVWGPATLANDVIAGGGIGVDITAEGAATMSSCTISGCVGTGVSVAGTASLMGCTITSGPGVGVRVVGAASIAESVIAGNGGAGVAVTGTAVLANNTIAANAGGVTFNTAGTGSLTNNIIAFNNGYGVDLVSGTAPTLVHNDLYGNAPGNTRGTAPGATDLSLDPLFMERASGNYRLQPSSPCRDAGDDSVVRPGETDADGNPRIYGAHVDIGAFELATPPRIWFVSTEGDDAGDGSSWPLAKRNIGAAVSAAHGGDEVWVAKGIYTGKVAVPAGVALYGGFAGTEAERTQRRWAANTTIFEGEGETAEAVVSCYAAGTAVDGFTVRNAATGIMVAGTARLANVTVSSCSATGVSISGAATLTNSVVAGNGRGVYVSGTATLANDNFVANLQDGVYVESARTLNMANCILAFNGRNGVTGSSNKGTLSRNDVFGNHNAAYGGTVHAPTDIAVDPRLSGIFHDAHLQPGSPCIDAGDDSVVTAGETDQFGKPRILGSHVDIGVDESDGTVWPPSAAVLHVSPDGSDTGDGLSWATAQRSIAGALSRSQLGDELWIARGVYTESASLPPGVSLYGGFAGTETNRRQRDWNANVSILDGGGATSGSVVTCAGTGHTLDGLTIRNGFYGVTVSGIATIANCRVLNHRDGIMVPGEATLTRNTVSGSVASAVYVTGSVTVNSSVLTGNGYGLALLGSSNVVNSCLVAGNTQGGIYVGSGAGLYNNTICDNPYGIYLKGDAYAAITNNILAFCHEGLNHSGFNIWYKQSYNDVFGNAHNYVGTGPWDTEISKDPLFVNRSAGDYRLSAGSPCIDAGGPPLVSVPVDLDNRPRILGARIDIGAYEYGTIVWTPAHAAKVLSYWGGLAESAPSYVTRLDAVQVYPSDGVLDIQDAVLAARKAAGTAP